MIGSAQEMQRQLNHSSRVLLRLMRSAVLATWLRQYSRYASMIGSAQEMQQQQRQNHSSRVLLRLMRSAVLATWLRQCSR
ncbi:hypothetical protein DUNSADRAFT_12427 [Dunaliella salina]|uniref:Encoded protein n=1 Tax=Dunaliella salina TaxID=3046 RepID=A0ABQ7GBB5_DUNSA|nr:hypothetical protein DUNSADRAFT_12427 [Dunaliella salina]|eukprot:KAF5831890.1 hypothetical protein DUNSADRAFT_12427 [Dunaliella salina]